MKKILVLGGHGFMGKNIKLLFDNDKNYQMYYISKRDGFDFRILSDLNSLLTQIYPDIIINAAAHVGSMSYVSKYSGDVIKDNSLMYLNLYESVSQVNPNIKIINPISNCSYPGIIDIQDEDNWWSGPIHHSVESYGAPKKLGFILSECYKNQYNIKTTNLIIPNSYGPEDYLDEERTHAMNGIIMRMIKSKNNKDNQFVIWGTGTPIREWIFMPDVARIIKQIVDEDLFEKLPNPINLGQRHGISIKDTVQMIKNSLNYDVELVYDTTKTDGAPIKVLGNKLFNEYFPSFNFTSYEDGISNTINYYKKLL
jgi:GDP-L-fucose synthase